jgi:hypothetical protein
VFICDAPQIGVLSAFVSARFNPVGINVIASEEAVTFLHFRNRCCVADENLGRHLNGARSSGLSSHFARWLVAPSDLAEQIRFRSDCRLLAWRTETKHPLQAGVNAQMLF